MNIIKFLQSVVLILSIASMTACNVTSQPTATTVPTEPPKPSATVVPATNTSLPPTNTAVPPTNTFVPPTNTFVAPTNTTAPIATVVATAILAPTNTKAAATLAPVVPTAAPIQPTATSAALPSGQGKLTIVNSVNFAVRIVLWGGADKSVDIQAGQTIVLDVPVGEYGWQAFANRCQLNSTSNLQVKPDNTLSILPYTENSCGYLLRRSK